MLQTYLTIYSGTLLPPFYIGSTSLDKFNKGYHGTVLSKKYKLIYNSELKNNPHLFDSCIIDEFETRKEATECELYYQKQMNAVKSELFFNMSIASKDGCFGMDTSGENHPLYGSHNGKGHIHSYNPSTGETSFLSYIPAGYVKGRKFKASSHNKGKKWYNDGFNKKMFIPGQQPKDWVIGNPIAEIAKINMKRNDGIYDLDIQNKLKDLWIKTGYLPSYKFRELAISNGFEDDDYHTLIYKIFKSVKRLSKPKKVWANDGIKSFMCSDLELVTNNYVKGRLK